MTRKICKTKLIALAKNYTEITVSNSEIRYCYYRNSSKIFFQKFKNAHLYDVKIEFTFFDKEYVLNIELINCSDRSDFERKFIRLGPDFPCIL